MLWLIVCSYHVTHLFQSESTLYSCLNVKELLARSRRHIWRLSDCNRTQMASLAKWLGVRLQTKWLWVRVPLQSLRMLLFGKFACFVFCNHRFFGIRPFTLLPTNKSSRFQNNTWCSLWVFWEKSITNEPLISTGFLFFVYLSTFLILLNLFHANNPFLHAAKTSENYRFSGVFRGYINGTLAWNGLTIEYAWNLNVRHSINRRVFHNKQ